MAALGWIEAVLVFLGFRAWVEDSALTNPLKSESLPPAEDGLFNVGF